MLRQLAVGVATLAMAGLASAQVLHPTGTYNYSTAYTNVFGTENHDGADGANVVVSSGFSVYGTGSDYAGAAAWTGVDLPAYPAVRETYGYVYFNFSTPQSNVRLFGIGATLQQFQIQDLASPTMGQIVVDYSSLFASPQSDSAGVDWTLMGNIYLDNNGSQVASAHIDSTRTGQLVYTGLLNPDDNISLRFYAYADVATFDGGTLSGNKSVMVEFHDWSISVAAIPEPETYSMLLAGLGLLGFAARRRKQKEAALA